MINKILAKRNFAELNAAIIFHWVVFIAKNTLIIFLLTPQTIPEEGGIKDICIGKIIITFAINLGLFVGFMEALVTVDITQYRSTIASAVILYMLKASTCLQILGIFIINSIRIYWILVFLIGGLATLEFGFAYHFTTILGPITLKSITVLTNDSCIIEAYQKRKNFKSLRIMVFTFLSMFVAYRFIMNLYENEPLNKIECKNPQTLICLVEWCLVHVAFLVEFGIFVLLNLCIRDTSYTPRNILLVLNGVAVVLHGATALISFTQNYSFLGTNLFYIHAFLFYGYVFSVVLDERSTLETRLDQFLAENNHIRGSALKRLL